MCCEHHEQEIYTRFCKQLGTTTPQEPSQKEDTKQTERSDPPAKSTKADSEPAPAPPPAPEPEPSTQQPAPCRHGITTTDWAEVAYGLEAYSGIAWNPHSAAFVVGALTAVNIVWKVLKLLASFFLAGPILSPGE